MTKHFYLVAAAASALLIAAPMVPAEAATAHVLTIKAVGGTAVSTGAVLTTGLANKSAATFTLGKTTIKCASAQISAKVTSNPVVSATAAAAESVTASTLTKCSVKGAKITQVAINLPYNATVSAAKGNPVKVTGSSKSKPIGILATITIPKMKPFKCTFTAASLSGTASNKGNVISFSKQKFKFSTGTSKLCKVLGTTAVFSATYGPLTDTSVSGSPAVFFN